MNFKHIIITHFCFRGKNAFKHLRWPGQAFYIDPLTKKNLEHRFKLFEMLCLPSIVNQSKQNFAWVIVIDKKLSNQNKQRLKKLIDKKEKSFLIEYDDTLRLDKLDWLKPFIDGQPDYVITTNHDDDDALPENYVEQMHKYLHSLKGTKPFPPIKLMGCNQIVQWELTPSKKAPLGWKSPWHRDYATSSCGFSLLAKYPEYNHSVSGIIHKFAYDYFDFTTNPITKHIALVRKAFLETSNQHRDSLTNFNMVDLFYDMGKTTGPVLMSNHSRNAQFERLYEKKEEYIPVTGPGSFPGIPLDWANIKVYIKSFRKDHQLFIIRSTQKFIRKLKRKTKRKLRNLTI